jgi:hypothetical protein
LIAHQGNALEVGIMFQPKLEVIPGRMEIPTVKVLELGK